MKRFAVIGLGRFGFHAARALFEEGSEVVAIDCDRSKVQLIEPYCSEAIVLDATDRERLKPLGLGDMDGVIVSMGSNISNSILICLYLQEFGVKKVVAKALDEDHAKILTKVGATDIVHPEKDMAIRVAREMIFPNVMDYMPLAKDYTLAQIEAPDTFNGKTLSELDLRSKYHVQVIAVKDRRPESAIRVPTANYQVQDDDVLVMLGKNEDINQIQKLK